MEKKFVRSNYRLTEELDIFLEDIAKKRKLSKNKIISELLENYKKKCEKVLTNLVEDDTMVS